MLKASIAASLLVAVLASPGRLTPSHAVSALRAYLYHQETGAVDTTNLMAEDRRAPPLWNTIIGEGTAGSPSAATLVLVQLSGSFLAGTSGSVRVVAQEETRILL